MSPDLFSIIQVFIQIAQFLLLLGGLIYAWRQVVHLKNQWSEETKLRKLQATREILNEIGREEVADARHWVLRDMPETYDPKTLSDADRKKLWRVLVSLDRVAYMVKQGLIPDEALFNWQGDEIQLLWVKLERYIRYVRESEHRQHYACHFEWLAKGWLPNQK